VFRLEGLSKTTKIHSEDSRNPGRDSNCTPQKYNTEMLLSEMSRYFLYCKFNSCPKTNLIKLKKSSQKEDVKLKISKISGDKFMLCKICVFHGGDYEERRLLGCGAV
jgi:hypothetical protein